MFFIFFSFDSLWSFFSLSCLYLSICSQSFFNVLSDAFPFMIVLYLIGSLQISYRVSFESSIASASLFEVLKTGVMILALKFTVLIFSTNLWSLSIFVTRSSAQKAHHP